MQTITFENINVLTDDFIYKLCGIFTTDNMNTLLSKQYTNNNVNTYPYPYHIGNLLSFNGDLGASQLVSLCFSDFLLNAQVPIDLNMYFDYFVDGYSNNNDGIYKNS